MKRPSQSLSTAEKRESLKKELIALYDKHNQDPKFGRVVQKWRDTHDMTRREFMELVSMSYSSGNNATLHYFENHSTRNSIYRDAILKLKGESHE